MNAANPPTRLSSVLKLGRLIFVLAILSLLMFPAAAQSIYSQAYTFTTFTGDAIRNADGVGDNARFNKPFGVVADINGNIYVADTYNFTIRKITPAGLVTTIAGLAGSPGSSDGMNSSARFGASYSDGSKGITVDNAGNVYVADTANNTIRKITPVGTNWLVSTIAGLAGSYGTNDGTGTIARFGASLFGGPEGITVDNAGNVYVADTANNTIRKITPLGTNWLVSTIAGLAGISGTNDGTGTAARFNYPIGVAVDNAGNIYVADTDNFTIRKVTSAGVVTTLAGMAGSPGRIDGTGNSARFNHPQGVAVDGNGNLYLADQYYDTIRKITLVGTNRVVSTLAGNAAYLNQLGFPGGYQDGTGTNALFSNPCGVTVDSLGNVYVADLNNDMIREVTSAGVVSTIAGSSSSGSVDGTGSTARFNQPFGMAADSAGNLYVTDAGNYTIRRITSLGNVTTIAGLPGSFGTNDGAGNNARFSYPSGVAVDSVGNVFVVESYSATVRKITPAGLVSTIAGLAGISGTTDGTVSAARFYDPLGVAVDNAGNVFVADTGNRTIRKLTSVGTNWVVSTIAGQTGTQGTNDGTGTNAQFGIPEGMAVDADGNIFVADTGYDTIRELTLVGTNWVVSTIAGFAGIAGYSDGTYALLFYPANLAVDSTGDLYLTDQDHDTIRKITLVGTNRVVSTIAGQIESLPGSADGAGSAARFNYPQGVAVDRAGNVYVADTGNNTIREGVFTAYLPTNVVAYTKPAIDGQLVVTLLPPEANGQWRFPWEAGWHNSGDDVSNLVTPFNYPISFRSLSGYLTLSNNFVVAVTGGTTTYVTNYYYPTLSLTGTTNTGSLTVNIQPNAPSSSGWRFLSETAWRAPGSTAPNLPPDVYFIEFEPVSGYSKPASQAVQVYSTLPTVFTANYLLAQSPPGGVLLPEPVPVTNLNDMADYPFGFNGQLQTDVGYGSGVAVQTNVVLTAAHLVFNDQNLSYVNQAYWYFQQEAGVFQPKPLQARGWYVLSGYAAERTNDLQSGFYTPGQSSPQSRNFDVAALYFLSPVAGGGYGGYLPSDASPNTWLTCTSLKMLVGYPVDGSLFGDASIVPGTLYQTDPQPYPLSLATDPVDDQQVYLATWLLSYPGNSGGPLYVQYNGYYYPAGVYLGTLFNGTQPYASLVRAIDSNVVNMITLAASLGDNGTNGTGGGVITIIPNQAISANNPGYIQWQLGPSAAALAGAGWRLQSDPTYSTATNYTRAVTTTNAVIVEFKPVAGWNLPTNQTVTVLPGQLTTYNAFYSVTNPVLVARAALGIGITGTTGTVYQIQSRSSLASGSWIPVSTNTILSNGFNLILPLPSSLNQTSAFYRAVWLP